MTGFLLAYAVFLLSHVLPMRVGLKQAVMARFGRGAWIAGYSALSILLLIWLVWAAIRAEPVMVWPQGVWSARLALALNLLACLAFAGGVGRGNPGSVAFFTGGGGPGLAALHRHPILWAFLLWSLAHVAANGELAVILMFGGFALFSLIGMRALDRRAARAGVARPDAGAFAARLARAADWRLGVEMLAGLALFAALLAAHPLLIGPAPLISAGW